MRLTLIKCTKKQGQVEFRLRKVKDSEVVRKIKVFCNLRWQPDI